MLLKMKSVWITERPILSKPTTTLNKESHDYHTVVVAFIVPMLSSQTFDPILVN